MLWSDRSTRRAVRRSACTALVGTMLCLSTLSSWAAPAAAGANVDDPFARFVAEREKDHRAADTPAVSAEAASLPHPEFAQKVRDSASGMVLTAMNFLGVRYVRGGTTAEEGFDCSGFTRHVFENSVGLMLPRRADDQASAPGLVKVGRDDLQPGDLVFFNTLRRTFSHVGIYVGDDRFIHAPRTGGNVRVENMRISYWASRFTGARRAAGVGTDIRKASPSAPAAAPVANRGTPVAENFWN